MTAETTSPPQTLDISIVLPCLNESESLPLCLPIAIEALALAQQKGFTGEIVVADNGSSDGSQQIAESFGARVVNVPERGYGAALIGGFNAAKGRFLVMGDADGSYDFRQSIPMVEKLAAGADICMGSRFRGEIKPGAMPWKNRYIGNPILTGILNLFFRAGISDAHCGLRALTKTCFFDLKLRSTGMEFASEMVVKATLLEKRMEEVPATLSPDLRSRPPHLRPWRDGWRHLIFLFLLSPLWLFLGPGIIAGLAGAIILAMSMLAVIFPDTVTPFFGNSWAILASSFIILGQQCCIFALASHIYGVNDGYRKRKAANNLIHKLTLETFLITGAIITVCGLIILSSIAAYWVSIHFQRIDMISLQIVGTTLLVIGMQNIFGGFLLAIIGGNRSRFMG